MSSLRPFHRQAAHHFDERCKRKQTASQNIPFGSLGTEPWEPDIYICMLFSESSIKFLQVTRTFASCKVFVYVLIYFHNIVFFFRHLPTEIVIFINVCYQTSLAIVFPVLGAGFANVPPTFLISCEVQTRYSRKIKIFWTVYSRLFIRY